MKEELGRGLGGGWVVVRLGEVGCMHLFDLGFLLFLSVPLHHAVQRREDFRSLSTGQAGRGCAVNNALIVSFCVTSAFAFTLKPGSLMSDIIGKEMRGGYDFFQNGCRNVQLT